MPFGPQPVRDRDFGNDTDYPISPFGGGGGTGGGGGFGPPTPFGGPSVFQQRSFAPAAYRNRFPMWNRASRPKLPPAPMRMYDPTTMGPLASSMGSLFNPLFAIPPNPFTSF